MVVPATRYDRDLSGFFLISPFYNTRKFALQRSKFKKLIYEQSAANWKLSEIEYGIALPGTISASTYRYTSDTIDDIAQRVSDFTWFVALFIRSLQKHLSA